MSIATNGRTITQPQRVNLRHGLKSVFALGLMPKGCGYVGRLAAKLRRQLEAAVIDRKGKVGLVDAAHIDAAVKWERFGLLAHRWLRLSVAEMTYADRLNHAKAIAQAAESRNRAIAALGLDRVDDLRDTLYAHPLHFHDPEPDAD